MKKFFQKHLKVLLLSLGLFSLSYSFAAAGYVNDILPWYHYSRGANANAINTYSYSATDGNLSMNNTFNIYNSNGVTGKLNSVALDGTVYSGNPFYTNLFLWDNYLGTWGWRNTSINGEFLGPVYNFYPAKSFNDDSGHTYMYNTVVTNPYSGSGTEIRQYTYIYLQ